MYSLIRLRLDGVSNAYLSHGIVSYTVMESSAPTRDFMGLVSLSPVLHRLKTQLPKPSSFPTSLSLCEIAPLSI